MSRSNLLTLLLSVATLPASCLAHAAEVRDPDVLAEHFVEAWNAHAPDIFTGALDSDADWITARGERLRGRPAIRLYLANEHTTWAKRTTMSVLGVESRVLCDGVAVVVISWKITDDNDAAFRGMTQLIARRTASVWTVISGQVTSGRVSQTAAGTAEQAAAGDARNARA